MEVWMATNALRLSVRRRGLGSKDGRTAKLRIPIIQIKPSHRTSPHGLNLASLNRNLTCKGASVTVVQYFSLPVTSSCGTKSTS